MSIIVAGKRLLALVAIGFAAGSVLIASDPGSAKAGEMIEVHGSTTVARNVLIPNKDELDKVVGRKIHVIANGSSKGIIALLGGKADIAMISAPFEDVRASVERKQPGLIGDAQLVEHRIGAIKTRFIVHPSNPVRSISKDQLRDILLGKITNWSEVGGPDMPVAVFTTKPGKGLRSLVEEKLLDGQSVVGTAQELGTLQQVVQVIGQAKHGIGFVNVPRLDDSVAELEGSFVDQPLILVTKGPADTNARALIDAMAQRAPSS
jgi:phosphate transport system substrate-binding protein